MQLGELSFGVLPPQHNQEKLMMELPYNIFYNQIKQDHIMPGANSILMDLRDAGTYIDLGSCQG